MLPDHTGLGCRISSENKNLKKKTESSVDLGSTVCGFALSPHVPTRKHISLPSPFPPYMQT